MKSMRWTVPVLLVAVLLSASAAGLDAQTNPVRVEELRLDPQAHVDQLRTVEGVVDRLVSRAGSETTSFYLEDDFGHQILVVPFDAPPARGTRLTVTGVVTVDPSGDPVLGMLDPDDGAAVPAAQPTPAETEPVGSPAIVPPPLEQSAPAAGGGRSRWKMFLIGGGVLFGLLMLSVYAFNRGAVAAGAPAPIVTAPLARKDVDFATNALWPESEQEFDGRTLRFSRPDPTVQLMPARLEIIGGGDAGEEIRFVAVPGETIEMMFGRSPGEGPTSVELKKKTVSRTHAIIRHRHGEWLLENLSMTNPTVMNDEVLGVKERLLTDGDRIEMGEVTFRFRTS